ncbi:hypothetical protein [Rhizobium laguerreae]|uniref:hypothetical protein n=1 Tax=Rhizobium laguerreae TaxID=1076926 RepID=UPI001C91F2BF|nr:hypothetical protein [Rhizobium laguerreae]MBY3347977.1 hypothetical protein [Rhizobium laguerreae]MBY3354940.1 hypothetical protein [Rhizobium laguerreae]MBY3376245.1 hypothetical protein [Rhizobium laguerreae]MBY3431244.1 hypothetical protein [Rhizobium laguerreae]MBY3439860.1 hypothetical protein [Rhizobium laguerreae]
MNPTVAVRLLAAWGVVLVGPLTSDAMALASAIESGSKEALWRFADDHAGSAYAAKALGLLSREKKSGVVIRTAGFTPLPQGLLQRGERDLVIKVQSREHDSFASHGNRGEIQPSVGRESPERRLHQRAAIDISTKLHRFKRDVEKCNGAPLSVTQNCVAGALEKFARGIEASPKVQGGVATVAVPALEAAASKLRTASSKAEARAAVAAAVPVIRKSISLIVAGDDDAVYRLQMRQRALVIEALTISDQTLVQATGI